MIDIEETLRQADVLSRMARDMQRKIDAHIAANGTLEAQRTMEDLRDALAQQAEERKAAVIKAFGRL